MNNKKLFLVGIMTAMMLSPAAATAAYAQSNVKAYYKSIIRYEMKDLTEEERTAYFKEILDQEVSNGIITKEQAQKEFEELKQYCTL